MSENIYAKRNHEAQGAYYLRHIHRMTVKGLHSKSAIAGELAHRDAEIAALKAENLNLEALCDATYVAQGADAYNHACEVLETWQEKRIAQGKEPGCVGSLCGGMEWLYAQVSGQETEIAALRKDAERYRWLRENENDELPTIAESFFWRGAGDASPQFFKSAKETDAAIDAAIAQAVQP